MRRRHHGGMTLIEVIIASFIMITLLLALMGLLVAGKGMYQTGQSRVSNAQDVQHIIWKMVTELRDTDVAYITNNTTTTPNGFSFLSAYDSSGAFITDTGGLPTIQKVVVYYLSGTTLYRREVTGSYSAAISASTLSGLCDGTGNGLSTAISAMSLTTTTSTNSAVLALTASLTDNNGNTDKQSTSLTVHMRN